MERGPWAAAERLRKVQLKQLTTRHGSAQCWKLQCWLHAEHRQQCAARRASEAATAMLRAAWEGRAAALLHHFLLP